MKKLRKKLIFTDSKIYGYESGGGGDWIIGTWCTKNDGATTGYTQYDDFLIIACVKTNISNDCKYKRV